MEDVMVDLRKYDLADRLKLDMISVAALINDLENALDEIESLKEQLEDLKREKDSLYYMGSSNQYEYGE